MPDRPQSEAGAVRSDATPEQKIIALQSAVTKKDLSAAKAALDAGADINGESKIDPWSPLRRAALQGDVPTMKFLLDHGAEVDRADSAGNTALLIIASTGSTEGVKLLLDHGANINAQDSQGHTPLLRSLDSQLSVDAAKVLVARGADVTIQDGKGPSAEGRARMLRNPELIKAIQESAAKQKKKESAQ